MKLVKEIKYLWSKLFFDNKTGSESVVKIDKISGQKFIEGGYFSGIFKLIYISWDWYAMFEDLDTGLSIFVSGYLLPELINSKYTKVEYEAAWWVKVFNFSRIKFERSWRSSWYWYNASVVNDKDILEAEKKQEEEKTKKETKMKPGLYRELPWSMKREYYLWKVKSITYVVRDYAKHRDSLWAYPNSKIVTIEDSHIYLELVDTEGKISRIRKTKNVAKFAPQWELTKKEFDAWIERMNNVSLQEEKKKSSEPLVILKIQYA